MSPRRFRPCGEKRKAPGSGICHQVKPAALSKTAARILQPQADKRGRTEEVENGVVGGGGGIHTMC